MTHETTRRWWPFPVRVPADQQSVEVKAKLDFLNDASRRGFRAYADQSDDCGAIAADGRECLLVWRGKQRAEMILLEPGKLVSKKLFLAREPAVAFRQASATALAWLSASKATSS